MFMIEPRLVWIDIGPGVIQPFWSTWPRMIVAGCLVRFSLVGAGVHKGWFVSGLLID
jgi:hypothetical protein